MRHAKREAGNTKSPDDRPTEHDQGAAAAGTEQAGSTGSRDEPPTGTAPEAETARIERPDTASTTEFPPVDAAAETAAADEPADETGTPGETVRRILAVAYFQLAGYIRSGQVLFPLVLLALIIVAQSGTPAGAASSFADAAAFALPVFALTAHQLLGAEPDAQRAISMRAAGSRWAYLAAGLLAALAVNAAFLLLSTASALRGPLGGHALAGGSLLTTILVGLAVHLLTYLPGVALGALTSRTITGDAPAEYVGLACGLAIAVVPGLASGPASWIALPLFRMLRAANGDHLDLAAPGIALHVAIWTAVVAAAYVALRLRRGTV